MLTIKTNKICIGENVTMRAPTHTDGSVVYADISTSADTFVKSVLRILIMWYYEFFLRLT